MSGKEGGEEEFSHTSGEHQGQGKWRIYMKSFVASVLYTDSQTLDVSCHDAHVHWRDAQVVHIVQRQIVALLFRKEEIHCTNGL